MENEVSMKERTKLALKTEGVLICILSIMAALWFLCSCTTTRYVTVPEVHEQHHWHTDSVVKKDSAYHEKETTIMQLDSAEMARYGIKLEKAERAWLVKTSELQRQIERLEAMSADRDTVRDSIPKPYPVEVIKEVPADLSWWQKMMMGLGVITIGIIVVIVVYRFGKWHLSKLKP